MLPSLKLAKSFNTLCLQISEIETQNHADFIYEYRWMLPANTMLHYNDIVKRYYKYFKMEC